MVHSVVEELAGLKQGFTDIIPPHVLAGKCPDLGSQCPDLDSDCPDLAFTCCLSFELKLEHCKLKSLLKSID